MHFSITKPKGLLHATFNVDDETVGEALNSAYGEDPRRWEINYCDVIISLTPACIADIYDDLLRLLDFVNSGTIYDSNFLSPEITCFFKVEPIDDEVIMQVKWVDVVGDDVLAKLQELPKKCTFKKNMFIAEITNFLTSVKDDLISLGYGHHFDEQNPWGVRIH